MSSASAKKLNLKTVAALLNVSVATVSNAFNRPDQLSPELRQKILQQCAELGYDGPNAAARSLRTGKSGIIAILLSDSLEYSVSDPVANQLIKGVAEVIQEQGLDLLLLSSRHNTACSSAEALPDGFILYGAPSNQEQLQRILKSGKPLISVDCNLPGVAAVNVDNYAAARQIASHALTQNEGAVAVLGLRLIDSERVCRIQPDELYGTEQSISRRRLDGYLAAAEQHGRQIPAQSVWHIPLNTHHYALIAAREALTQFPRPQVLLCMSDRIALAAMTVARELGIAIPQELVVAGFDGIEEGERFFPSLTTIAQHSDEKGRTAARRLLAGDLQTDLLMPSELIQRQSC
ncbi:LacI family DNA-binding transcriptional regulator [Rheinheimera sp.]|uniref:LacI family DNA-binding transcriptional regulator n=1 Tax=Rheinheimera sp. TaxID=1869214 RepID=UPI00307FB9B9